jgi:hypothetical protein
MGAAASTPFPRDAVVECCVKVVNLFGPIYLKAYALALLDEQAKAAPGSGTAASVLALQRPPVAKEPLEKGWLTKLGDVKKNWKRRWFVAMEEAGEVAFKITKG